MDNPRFSESNDSPLPLQGVNGEGGGVLGFLSSTVPMLVLQNSGTRVTLSRVVRGIFSVKNGTVSGHFHEHWNEHG
jgi:hypothetical protein